MTTIATKPRGELAWPLLPPSSLALSSFVEQALALQLPAKSFGFPPLLVESEQDGSQPSC